jgi:hypothetical protein
LSREYFYQVGDEINVLMAACAWNLRKWLVIATILALFFHCQGEERLTP